MDRGLAYAGQIAQIRPIEGADRVVSAVVICGHGGKWNTVVPKDCYEGQLMTVFLPDAIVPNRPELEFMEKNHWRVSMRRFKGAPSEALAVPDFINGHSIGDDMTEELGVTKFEKPIPANLAGDIYGPFPSFIPKTDEPRYQSVPEMVQALIGVPVVITLKMDGSSVTAYRYNGHFGVCSRNWELKDTPHSAQWQLVKRYGIDESLGEGHAIQFEICGPGIQKNPAGLKENTGYVFNAYSIVDAEYRDFIAVRMPTVPYIATALFREGDEKALQEIADEVKYIGDRPAEGIVVRPLREMQVNGERLSFKVINLNYKD